MKSTVESATNPIEPRKVVQLGGTRDGKFLFTGIVMRRTSNSQGRPAKPIFYRLNNPNGSLNGNGHHMCTLEFQSELSHYDNLNFDSDLKITQVKTINASRELLALALSRRPHQVEREDDGQSAQTSSKNQKASLSTIATANAIMKGIRPPTSFSPQQDVSIKCYFTDLRRIRPFLLSGCRAGDKVQVVTVSLPFNNEGGTIPLVEPLWLHVVSITCFGMVTGRSLQSISHCNIRRDIGLLCFPYTTIAQVRRGKNWR